MKIISSLFFVVCLLLSSVVFAGSGADFHLDKNLPIKSNVFVSQVIELGHPMDRAVLSWNVRTPDDSFVEFLLRAKSAKGAWSNWFVMGTWGEDIASASVKGQSTRFGKVDIDTLELSVPASKWQYKIVLHKGKSGALPTIYSIGLAAKNSKTYKKEAGVISENVRTLDVPRFSQFEAAKKDGKPELAKRICSPTSVAMLLAFNGVANLSPLDVAAKVYDKEADAYGNWSFNVATMFEYLDSSVAAEADRFATYVRWYESFDELLDNVRRGEPVAVSVGFKKGELKGAPVPTAGHLVVVRGADEKYVYVNDPAASTKRSVARKYLRDEFVRAWKGVAYVSEVAER